MRSRRKALRRTSTSVRHSSTRPRFRRTASALENLEQRLALHAGLDVTFRPLDFTISGSIDGGTDIPDYEGNHYRDDYTGSISGSGTITYSSETTGSGLVSVGGSGSGSDDVWASYQFTYDSVLQIGDSEGQISGGPLSGDFDYVEGSIIERVFPPPSSPPPVPDNLPLPLSAGVEGTFELSGFTWELDSYRPFQGGTSGLSVSGSITQTTSAPFDLAITRAAWTDTPEFPGVECLEIEIDVTGRLLTGGSHSQVRGRVEAYWANSSGTQLGDALFDEPVYWNSGKYTFHSDGTLDRPTGATHLVVNADPDGSIVEASESNNSEFVAMSPDIEVVSIVWDQAQGGAEVTYRIIGADLEESAELLLKWSPDSDPNNGAAFGAALVLLPEGGQGEHTFRIAPDKFNPPGFDSLYVHAIADPQGKLNECNIDNNQQLLALVLEPLTVEIIATPDSADMGELYSVSAVVKNNGPVPLNFQYSWGEIYPALPELNEPAAFEGQVSKPNFGKVALLPFEETILLGNFVHTWEWISPENPLLQLNLDTLKDAGALIASIGLSALAETAGTVVDVVTTVGGEIAGVLPINELPLAQIHYVFDIPAFHTSVSPVTESESVVLSVGVLKQLALQAYKTAMTTAQAAVQVTFSGGPLAGIVIAPALLTAIASYEQAIDPPDPNFSTFATAAYEVLPEVAALNDGPLKAYGDATWRLNQLMNAKYASKDKADGARIASDEFWQAEQLLAASWFAHQTTLFETQQLGLADLLGPLINNTSTPQNTDALPPLVVRELTEAGFTPAEIEQIYQDAIATLNNPSAFDGAALRNARLIQALVHAGEAIDYLKQSIELRTGSLGQSVTPISPDQRTRIDNETAALASVDSQTVPTTAKLRQADNLLRYVRELLIETNNFADLEADLNFAYLTKFRLQSYDSSVDGLIDVVEEKHIEGAVSAAAANHLTTLLEDAELAIANQNFSLANQKFFDGWIYVVSTNGTEIASSIAPGLIARFRHLQHLSESSIVNIGTDVVDNEDQNFEELSGTWQTSTGGIITDSTRQSSTPGASVRMTPDQLMQGLYRVQLYSPGGNFASAEVTLRANGAEQELVYDFAGLPGGWTNLGFFLFNGLGDEWVEIVNLDGETLKLDAIRFESIDNAPPYSTGTPNANVLEDAEPFSIDLRAYFNDSFDGSDLSYTIVAGSVSNPELLSILSINSANDVLTAEPGANVSGATQLTIQATDSLGASATVTATITVAPVNDSPTATGTTLTTNEDTAVDIDLRTLVDDVETADSVLLFAIGGAANGSITLIGGHTARFTPATNYNGLASFTYSVTDEGDGASPAITVGPTTINVNVTPVVDPGSLGVSSPTVNEAAGTMTFVVTLSGTVDGPFTVDYNTVAGSAGSGDYTSTSGALSFAGADGETRSVTVPISNDTLVELSESFQLALSNVQGTSVPVSVSTASGTGTIEDNDAASIAIESASAAENSGSITFSVTLTGSVDAPFTVSFATEDILGQAVAGSDYTATSGVLTFAGSLGETKYVTVNVSPDSRYEDDETFQLALSNLLAGGRNVAIFTGTAIGTIQNDDAMPTVTLSASPTTISENGGVSTVTANLSQASGLPTTVNLEFAGTAASGDYNRSGTSITIPAGETSGSITITGVNDSLSETSETVIIDVASISGASEATPQQASVTLANHSTVGTNLQVSSTMASSVVAGSGSLAYKVTIKNAGPLDVTNVLVQQSGVLPPGVTVKSVKPSTGSFSGTAASGTWTISSLKKNKSVTLTITLNVASTAAPGVDVISLTTAAVSANPGLLNTTDDSTSRSASIVTQADLSVTKSAPQTVIAGSYFAYTVTVKNSGPGNAQNVTLSDVLPSSVSIVSQQQMSGPSFTLSNTATAVSNTIGVLSSGASATFEIMVSVGPTSADKLKITSSATVSSISNDPKTSNNKASATTTVAHSGAAIAPSMTDSGKQDLIIGGTSKNDSILVSPSGSSVLVTLNGKKAGTFKPTGNIVAYGRAGNDTITVSPLVNIPAILLGEAGNDTLNGGGAEDVLVGGNDNDTLSGGVGRNILIAGLGANMLNGGPGANIQIGGRTSFDTNVVALTRLLAEWSRTDEVYENRIEHLRGTTTDGLNDGYFLNSSTVFDNGMVDKLIGGGSGDWFFADLDGSDEDEISLYESGEEIDAI